MKTEEKLKMCRGCRNDFYNDKNPLGVKVCWSLDKAVVELKKEVSVNHVPPWNQDPRPFLKCYHKDGYVHVAGHRTC